MIKVGLVNIQDVNIDKKTILKAILEIPLCGKVAK